MLIDRCLHGGVRGEPVARLLAPAEDDYFVLKPLHSGFYSTALDLLLRELGSEKLVICGLATEGCVLFTASDAYIRGFEISVPRDGCASESPARHRGALDIMQKMLKADTRGCSHIRFRNVKRKL
jgi:nicotinamidase-related amidase